MLKKTATIEARAQASLIGVRDIESIAEMKQVEELQKEVWGFADRDVIPFHQLLLTQEAGGTLIGAFDGGSVVAFVYGFLSYQRGRLQIHSHLLAVKPAYRSLGLGYRLKLYTNYKIRQSADLGAVMYGFLVRPLRFRVFPIESPLESFPCNVARPSKELAALLISRSMIKLEFEWNDAKAEANWRAHGVSFELAKTVFNDPFAIERVDDREDYGEQRFVIIGMAEGHVLLFVAYTERKPRIRLISARRVTQYEQEDYFWQNA